MKNKHTQAKPIHICIKAKNMLYLPHILSISCCCWSFDCHRCAISPSHFGSVFSTGLLAIIISIAVYLEREKWQIQRIHVVHSDEQTQHNKFKFDLIKLPFYELNQPQIPKKLNLPLRSFWCWLRYLVCNIHSILRGPITGKRNDESSFTAICFCDMISWLITN